MDSSHATDISQEWLYNQDYVFGINVDKVDLQRYPNVANVPWYKAVVDEGDCLYVPFHWIHQVRETPWSIHMYVYTYLCCMQTSVAACAT